MVLFIDTETTGLPRDYYQLEQQPHVVQLAAILCDDSRHPVASMNRIIRPEGWDIPMEATAIHGYTTGFCRRNGIPLSLAMRELLALWQQATRVVAYNARFDECMVRASGQRTGVQLPPRDIYCAMQQAAKVVGGDSGRWLKLGVAYARFFGGDLDGAHDAMADVEACRRVYYAIEDSVAPAAGVIGDIRLVTRNKLQKAVAGIQEVEEHQRLISSFVTLHCGAAAPVNWGAIAATPLPAPPAYSARAEEAAVRKLQTYRPNIFARLLELDRDRIADLQEERVKAKEEDRQRYQQAMRQYQLQRASIEERRQFAQGILSRSVEGYNRFLDSGDMFESPLLARNVLHSFPDGSTVEVFAYLNGPDIIPAQSKRLLGSGRVSIKKKSNKEFVALYQDHLCSAVLRIAREFFAALPLERSLIHAYAPVTDTTTGQSGERCVLSCALEREALATIRFEQIDPSDCISSFRHAMKLSKGSLMEVAPLAL